MDWSKLSTMSGDDLLAAGWRRWNEACGRSEKTLFLIPAALYDEIPDGLEIVTIGHESKIFEKGYDDTQLPRSAFIPGDPALTYGVLRTE